MPHFHPLHGPCSYLCGTFLLSSSSQPTSSRTSSSVNFRLEYSLMRSLSIAWIQQSLVDFVKLIKSTWLSSFASSRLNFVPKVPSALESEFHCFPCGDSDYGSKSHFLGSTPNHLCWFGALLSWFETFSQVFENLIGHLCLLLGTHPSHSL